MVFISALIVSEQVQACSASPLKLSDSLIFYLVFSTIESRFFFLVLLLFDFVIFFYESNSLFSSFLFVLNQVSFCWFKFQFWFR